MPLKDAALKVSLSVASPILPSAIVKSGSQNWPKQEPLTLHSGKYQIPDLRLCQSQRIFRDRRKERTKHCRQSNYLSSLPTPQTGDHGYDGRPQPARPPPLPQLPQPAGHARHQRLRPPRADQPPRGLGAAGLARGQGHGRRALILQARGEVRRRGDTGKQRFSTPLEFGLRDSICVGPVPPPPPRVVKGLGYSN